LLHEEKPNTDKKAVSSVSDVNPKDHIAGLTGEEPKKGESEKKTKLSMHTPE